MATEVKLIVPDSLEEVTLGEYQSYLRNIEGLDDEKDAEIISKKLIEAFCGIEYSLVDSIPLRDIENVLGAIRIAFERDYEHTLRFKLLDVDMGFIPKMDDMSLGEYIDCENYISNWEDMHKAMAVLYRPVNFKKGDKYTIAPYKPSDDMAELMKEMPLSVVMGCTVFFLSFRESVVKGYPELYGEDDTGEQYQLSSEGGFGKKWGWYQSIYALAQGDVRRFDEVTSLPLHQCLTFLTFEKEKNELEVNMIKKQYNQ